MRARVVRYLADRDVLDIETTRDWSFTWIDLLQDIPATELAQLKIWPGGSAIELEARDVQISEEGLLTAVLPASMSEAERHLSAVCRIHDGI